jgi:hypothetical protein
MMTHTYNPSYLGGRNQEMVVCDQPRKPRPQADMVIPVVTATWESNIGGSQSKAGPGQNCRQHGETLGTLCSVK